VRRSSRPDDYKGACPSGKGPLLPMSGHRLRSPASNERLPPTAAGGAHHGVTVRGGGDRPRGRAAALRGGRPRRPARQRQSAGTPRPWRAVADRRTGGSSRPYWCREAFGARRGGEGGLRDSSRVGCTGAGRVGRPARPSRATACPARRACSGRRDRRLPSRVGCRPPASERTRMLAGPTACGPPTSFTHLRGRGRIGPVGAVRLGMEWGCSAATRWAVTCGAGAR